MYRFIAEEEKKIRLDLFLKEKIPSLSRSFIQRLIKEENVKVNGCSSEKDSLISKGDKILVAILPLAETEARPEPIPVDILWEDENLVVVNKPAGMLSHPTSKGEKNSLVNALLLHSGHLCEIGAPLREGIVHRLDKDTSGVMVVAKDNYTYLGLSAQFRKRVVKKTYSALVRGIPSQEEGLIEGEIGRDPKRGKKMILGRGLSHQAVTHYQVLKKWKNYSLLELHPLTGRTHQIRLHLHLINCFLMGDKIYGGKKWQDFPCKLKRAMLHAKSLGFFHPKTGEWMEFKASLPPDMQNIIDYLNLRFLRRSEISDCTG
ncbi:MAG: RluA family pseudouridine synthase [Candidatus Aerophobetes bacterium]|nr:RluA family pseudouridine synthase [Candidatus Aerophobetes bacterium]